MTDQILASASAIERELGVSHGTVAALVKQKRIALVWLPGHKRPKYERKAVYRALGVDYVD